MPGTAHDGKELPSFPVRTGAIRPLSDDSLTVQTSGDALPDVSWAEDIISVMDSTDAHPIVDPADQIPESSTRQHLMKRITRKFVVYIYIAFT